MRRVKLHWWILAGMIVGAVLGGWVHATADPTTVETLAVYQAFDGIANIFLKLLKLVVIPLVFFSLINGMLGMGDIARLGRMGLKTFGLYILTSLLALVTGLVLVNAVGPGVGLDLSIPAEGKVLPLPDSPWEFVLSMIPDNIVRAAAETDLLGVIVFALLFGAFVLALPEERRRLLGEVIAAIADVMMMLTRFIIALAPVGIAALIARMVASTGPEVFWEMRWYVVTILGGLAVHVGATLPLLIWLVTRRNPYRYLRTMLPAFVTGFSTASSVGTLGVTMERAENGAGISDRVTSFVLPIGATVNMDGTALYELVTVIFIAQIHATIDPTFTLTLGQQLLIVFLGLTVSIGAAGIPHAGLVMMVIILQAVGLPVEYTALIWAVDRPLDMCRTATNIASDSTITLVVAHTEKQIDESVLWNSSAR